MSLATDKFFFNALKGTSVDTMVNGRIFNTARSTEDETEDRVPYVIIAFNGLQNDEETKDSYEGDYDRVTISITCVATTREALAELTQAIRTTIKTACEEGALDECPDDYSFSASSIEYDMLKPCFFQSLTYICDSKS